MTVGHRRWPVAGHILRQKKARIHSDQNLLFFLQTVHAVDVEEKGHRLNSSRIIELTRELPRGTSEVFNPPTSRSNIRPQILHLLHWNDWNVHIQTLSCNDYWEINAKSSVVRWRTPFNLSPMLNECQLIFDCNKLNSMCWKEKKTFRIIQVKVFVEFLVYSRKLWFLFKHEERPNEVLQWERAICTLFYWSWIIQMRNFDNEMNEIQQTRWVDCCSVSNVLPNS